MDLQTSNTLEAALQTILSACGGEEQVAEQLAGMERQQADGVGTQQILRLLGELRSVLPQGVTLSGLQPQVTEVRPQVLECDVVRFQNNKEKWVALVGLLDGYPYEIFTGLQDDDEGIMIPKSVSKGRIVKQTNADGTKRYDFQFENTRGYKITVEGLSERFNPEYWNYAKLISGVLRYRMPIENVIKLVASLQLHDESINTWKNGVERALKKYLPGQPEADEQTGVADE
jgi:ribonucleoside-diphosphate reductase alpha chain